MADPGTIEAALSKAEVVAALRKALREELESVERVAAMARDEATSDETRQEGKYDTRATEASYLARGQAWRVLELRQLVGWIERFDPTRPVTVAGVGALIEAEGARRVLFLMAPIGGASVVVGGQKVRVISPSSPLGAAISDLEAGDVAEVDSPRGVTEYEILSIS